MNPSLATGAGHPPILTGKCAGGSPFSGPVAADLGLFQLQDKLTQTAGVAPTSPNFETILPSVACRRWLWLRPHRSPRPIENCTRRASR